MRLALGHERDHDEGPLAVAAQERDLGRVRGRVEGVDRRDRLGLEDPPRLRVPGEVEGPARALDPVRRPVAPRQEAVAGPVPRGDRALVRLEGVSDVLGDQVRHLPGVQAAREGAAHVRDPAQVLGEVRRGADRPRRFDRGGGLVGQDREDSHVGEVELVEAQLGERDHAGDPLVVAHRDDEHRLLDLVGARDRHPARIRVGVGDQERPSVGGDPAGEALAHLEAKLLEPDRLVAVVAGGHDRDQVVGLLDDVDPAGVVVHDRPDLVDHRLGDVADGGAAGHPGGGALGHLELGDPALGRLAGLVDLRPHRPQVGRHAIDLGASVAEAHDDEAEGEADDGEGERARRPRARSAHGCRRRRGIRRRWQP